MAAFSLTHNTIKSTVGIAELRTERCADMHMVTHALGSCIGITIFEPVAKVVGMLHFMLPEPGPDARHKPRPDAMFATTGVPQLFRKAIDMGASKSKMVVCIAGGSSLMDDKDRFQIGKRNRMILRKMFWKNGITVAADDTGGTTARTMYIDMTSGQVSVLSQGKEKVLWAA